MVQLPSSFIFIILAHKVIRYLQPYHMMTLIMITLCVVLDMEEHIVKV